MVQLLAYTQGRGWLASALGASSSVSMAQTSTKRAVESPVIPDRLYFKIGDVARLCGVESYVLRFWETQFPQLKPNKSGTGQRLYRRRDVELALEIKRLVHGEGYTIAGARQALEGGHRRGPKAKAEVTAVPTPITAPAAAPQVAAVPEKAKSTIAQVKAELKDILTMLATPPATVRRERAKVIKVRPESDSLFPM